MRNTTKLLLCAHLLILFACKARYAPNYYEVMPITPKTVFDSILKAKFNLTYFQYRNKAFAKAYSLNNYEGYLTFFDLPHVHTKKFPPIWINNGYAIDLDMKDISKYKKVRSFTWIPGQNYKYLNDVGRLNFYAE